MTERHVLVEGPDDVAALCELAKRLFFCGNDPRPATRTPSRAQVRITRHGARVNVAAAPNAKPGMARALVDLFGSFPPLLAGDEARVDRVAFFYDPDDDKQDEFADLVHKALETLPRWKVTRGSSDQWTLERHGEAPVALRGVAWKAAGPVLDDLDDLQNLERLLCRVMGSAYPSQQKQVATWLVEIRQTRASLGLKSPTWKAAVLLWAALVDEAATRDAGIPSRFFGQHKHSDRADFFGDHVKPQVVAAGLEEPLRWSFDE